MVNLSGKTALVTGASRGIGYAPALVLAQAGAQVLVHYGRGKAEAVVTEIRNGGFWHRELQRQERIRFPHTCQVDSCLPTRLGH
jgi:NAD(P)-dependent dehydrogenase (short-subunit alcohol dehydrogenase family)